MFKSFFSKQARRPSGLFGRFVMTRIFDKGNASLNEFMIRTLALRPGERVLEIGFGPGSGLAKMAGIVGQGCIEGIDFSKDMVRIAARRNRDFIGQGRVAIRCGSFDVEPYAPACFDAVCSTNTIYFWENPGQTASKIHDVLKPGGRVALAFADRDSLASRQLSEDVFRLYSADAAAKLLRTAGFSSVRVESESHGAMQCHCALAEKER